MELTLIRTNLNDTCTEGELRQRFEKYVYKTKNCWFWIGARNDKGYGLLSHSVERRAHRISWFLSHGSWPKQQILHTCDTPQCVNPEHLREGTNLENHQEAARKGTNPNLARQFKEFCKHGHPRTPENLYTAPKTGIRACRICANNRYELRKKNDPLHTN